MRLLRRIAGLLLFFALAPLGAVECETLVSLAPRLGDRVNGVPPNCAVPLPSVSKVSRHQPFHVYIFFRAPAQKDGKIRLATRVILHDPAGGICFDSRDSIQTFSRSGPRPGQTLLHPASCRISLGQEKPEGRYLVTAEVTDLNAKKTARSTAEITLAGRLPDGADFASMQELDRYMVHYYLAPDPERILPAFRFLARQLPELKKRRHPIPFMAWFYHALKQNPQLWKDFAAELSPLDPADRPHAVAVLAALTGKGRQPDQLRAIFEPPEKLTAPRQLDVLWSMFFATGERRPVERLCSETVRMSRGMTPQKYQEIAEPTAEEKAKLLDHAMGRGALWSLGANIGHHALVAGYVEVLLAAKKIPDLHAAQTLLKSLQARRAAAPAVRKPAGDHSPDRF